MTDPSILGGLRELTDRGLIASTPSPRLLSEGNSDRRTGQVRVSWRVQLPDGRAARLVLGRALADLSRRQEVFSHACPDLAASVFFYHRLASCDAFADDYFHGRTLETIALESPARATSTFAAISAALEATQSPSNEIARQAEWKVWTDRIAALPLWTTDERRRLGDTIGPRLYSALSTGPAVMRWTNGDLTASNILLSDSGQARLIDFEFAAQTHFFAEDAARFYALSPCARMHPGLFSGSLPRPAGPWQLFLWLRQLVLESEHNSAAYLARVLPARLGIIRRLAEFTLDCQLLGWSTPPTALHHTLESARWEQSAAAALYLSGWCHVSGFSLHTVIATQGDRLLAESAPLPRSDVRAHFNGEPLALASGFALSVPLAEPSTPVLIFAVLNDGSWLPIHRLTPSDLPGRGPWLEDYAAWSRIHDPDPAAPADLPCGPLFSILLPVYRPPPEFLRACVESVLGQFYPHWELCVVDDASRSPEIGSLLEKYASLDARIKVRTQSENAGIARSSNAALAAARGDFVVLLDHDDLLRPHALLEFAHRINAEPELDAIYSDEDKITADGSPVLPFLKPDFSPEFLLGVMYIGHALCVRSTLARTVGGFLPEFDGVQDYEFFLRVTEHTRQIGHIPRILYHWRQSVSSSALHGNIKGDMDAKQARAVSAYLKRRGRTEQVVSCGAHRLRLESSQPISAEILPIDPAVDPLATIRRGAERSRAEVLCCHMASPVAASDRWFELLAAVAARSDSALVAPLLLLSDGRVRESGWTIGPLGAAPVMRGFAAERDGYNGSLVCTREVAAVSPLCFAIRRALVLEILTPDLGAASWLKFCERLRQGSRFHRVCPHAWFQTNSDADHFMGRGEIAASADPFYNPNFDPLRADYSLASDPLNMISRPPTALVSRISKAPADRRL